MEAAETAFISAEIALKPSIAALKTIVFDLKIEEIKHISFITDVKTTDTAAVLEASEPVLNSEEPQSLVYLFYIKG
jgi:hypothetical protein